MAVRNTAKSRLQYQKIAALRTFYRIPILNAHNSLYEIYLNHFSEDEAYVLFAHFLVHG